MLNIDVLGNEELNEKYRYKRECLKQNVLNAGNC